MARHHQPQSSCDHVVDIVQLPELVQAEGRLKKVCADASWLKTADEVLELDRSPDLTDHELNSLGSGWHVENSVLRVFVFTV
jgi:hypothetical protein